MNTLDIQRWVAENMFSAVALGILIGVILFLFTRNFIARGLMQLAAHTKPRWMMCWSNTCDRCASPG